MLNDLLNTLRRSPRAARNTRRGATTVIMCMLLPAMLGVSAYVINVSYMEHMRTDLQITTDVSTRAAGRMLAVTGSRDAAISAAQDMLNLNPIFNHTVTLNEVDIVFGVSTRHAENERYNFADVGSNPNAVQVKGNGNLKLSPLFPTMGANISIRPIKTAISTQTELEIALVMDRSGSMAFSAAEISGPQNPAAAPPGWKFGDAIPPKARWTDACSALNLFLDMLNKSPHDEHVSLTTYNEKSTVDTALSGNFDLINQKMLAYSQKYKGGATNIGDGILDGLKTLSDKKTARSWATRVMIVMTDGRHNTGTDPVYAAQVAASQEVQIYTVTFSAEADIPRMQQVADIGSGKHYHAATADQLRAAFENIAKSLPTLITY